MSKNKNKVKEVAPVVEPLEVIEELAVGKLIIDDSVPPRIFPADGILNISAIPRGNREIDMAVDEIMKLKKQIDKLQDFIVKALSEKKR